jgi:tRNA-specific 2-thiouridylase
LTKPRVRELARERGLAVAGKPDSYDICFIPDGDTHGYLVEKLGPRRGAVVDAASGVQLAEHDGAFAFTIGQRKGLRLDRPAADGRPRYVLGIEPVSGTVTVGPAAGLDVRLIVADRVVFPGGRRPDFPVRAQLQLRAHGGTVGGSADLVDGDLRLSLDEPSRGVAPGQTVVLYGGAGLPAPAGGPSADQFVIAAGTIVRTG